VPGVEVVGVEQPFDVPLIDQETGEVLDRALVGTLDLLERDADGRLVVVDLKTSARKYTDLQVEASLQLSIYSGSSGNRVGRAPWQLCSGRGGSGRCATWSSTGRSWG
jgi:RecB family exonuclease